MNENDKKLLDKIRKIVMFALLIGVLIMLLLTFMQMQSCSTALNYLGKDGANVCKACNIFINSGVIQPTG